MAAVVAATRLQAAVATRPRAAVATTAAVAISGAVAALAVCSATDVAASGAAAATTRAAAQLPPRAAPPLLRAAAATTTAVAIVAAVAVNAVVAISGAVATIDVAASGAAAATIRVAARLPPRAAGAVTNLENTLSRAGHLAINRDGCPTSEDHSAKPPVGRRRLCCFSVRTQRHSGNCYLNGYASGASATVTARISRSSGTPTWR